MSDPTADDARLARQRAEEALARIGRLPRPIAPRSGAYLGQATGFVGGLSAPVTVDTKPIELGGVPVAGGLASLASDAAGGWPVTVTRGTVSAGDLLLAKLEAASGRWVAQPFGRRSTGPPPDCGSICLLLHDTCNNNRACGWTVKVTDPLGAVAYDGPAYCLTFPWNICLPLYPASPAGTYTFEARKTVDLSPWGGPAAYAMGPFTGTVTVTDPCQPYSLTINVCEDYVILSFGSGCFGTIIGSPPYQPCDPDVTVTLSTDVGSCTKTLGWAQHNVGTCVFYGYGCGVTSINYTITHLTPATIEALTGSLSLCPRPGLDYGFVIKVGSILAPGTGGGAAAGYICTGCCNWPIPKTLHYTDSSGVAVDLVYRAAGQLAGWWVGTAGNGSSLDTANPVGYGGCCLVTGGTYTCVVAATCTCTATGVKWYVVKWWYLCSGTPPDHLGPCDGFRGLCTLIGNQTAPVLDFSNRNLYSDATVTGADCTTVNVIGTLAWHGGFPYCAPQAAGTSNFVLVG